MLALLLYARPQKREERSKRTPKNTHNCAPCVWPHKSQQGCLRPTDAEAELAPLFTKTPASHPRPLFPSVIQTHTHTHHSPDPSERKASSAMGDLGLTFASVSMPTERREKRGSQTGGELCPAAGTDGQQGGWRQQEACRLGRKRTA